jgi:rhodanese-related sulfurtransferase
MKRRVLEITYIILFAALLGLIYNYFSDKPLPIIFKPPVIKIVSDSVLFEGIDTSSKKKNLNSRIKLDTDSINNITKQKDSKNEIPQKEIKTNVILNDAIKDDKYKNVKPQQKNEDSIYVYVSYKQVLKLLNNPKIIFIDARRHDDYDKAHIGNSINIFPYDPDDEYLGKINMLPRDKTYIVYCDGGACDLSHHVAKTMNDFGFKRVFVYRGGWDEWKIKNKIP